MTKGGGVAHKRRIKNRYTTGGNKSVTRSANGDDVATEEPVLHIFNFENNEGFAVMGGDKRGAPMLALTESGEFTPGATIDNPGMSMSLARAEAVNTPIMMEKKKEQMHKLLGKEYFMWLRYIKALCDEKKSGLSIISESDQIDSLIHEDCLWLDSIVLGKKILLWSQQMYDVSRD